MDSILSDLFIQLLPQHLPKGREGGEAFGEGLLVAGIADAHAVRLLEAVAGVTNAPVSRYMRLQKS